MTRTLSDDIQTLFLALRNAVIGNIVLNVRVKLMCADLKFGFLRFLRKSVLICSDLCKQLRKASLSVVGGIEANTV